MLENFAGNRELKEILYRLLTGSHIPHAILLKGEEGLGKHTVGRALSKAISSELLPSAPLSSVLLSPALFSSVLACETSVRHLCSRSTDSMVPEAAETNYHLWANLASSFRKV